MSSRLGRLTAACVGAVMALALSTPPTWAAPDAPTGLAPSQVSVSTTPVFQWERVAGATGYDVQVSASPTFSPTLWTGSTANRRVTPAIQLPGGDVYWRVRAKEGSAASGWSETSFSRSVLAGPALLAPANGDTLNPPEEPALLSWEPVTGAVQYTLQVSTDPQFVNTAAIKTYTTQTSSYVVPDPVVATDYFWRVRATLGSSVITEWSASQSYAMSGLDKPVLVSPSDSAQAEPLQDVVLDWEPVQGAKTYNLQISTDQNFNTIDHSRNSIVSTRYSPATTLDNDQYYWRVAPVDAAGNTLDWASVDVWEFRRNWPHQPALEYPVDNAAVGDPFYYQWTPVRHASSYRLQVATSNDFSDNSIYDECTTVNTTYVPTTASDCFPKAQSTYYWRVIATDGPANVVSEAVNAEIRRFTYDPSMVTLTAPAPGSTVAVPTLRWQPVAGANQYEIVLTRVDNGATTTAKTYGTSWTPRTKLAVGATYRWSVQTVSATGRTGPHLMTGSQPTFTVEEQPTPSSSTPEPDAQAGAPSTYFPTLTWSAVPGATRYVVFVRSQGTAPWTSLGQNFGYPAGEDATATWLAADTYEWKVEAWNASVFLEDSTAPGTFVIQPPAAVAGQRVSMNGTASASSATSCTKALDPSLPLAETQCTAIRATPVLRWTPQPGVGRYIVTLSRDQQLTNVIETYNTEQSAFTPTTALIDSQAGSAFFWQVRPCKVPGTCRAAEPAGHAFNKLSKPVQLQSPAVDQQVANDVSFTWRDYLATNQDGTTPGLHDGVHSVDPDTEAQRYRVQVDDDPNFQSPLDTVLVDQTTYTPYGATYPEGPLYWRVQALDGSNNPLTWSDARRFVKDSPRVTLASPVGGSNTTGSSPLRWEPLPYAASYDVEVYKNADTVGQPTNLVFSGSSKQVALSTPRPLPVSSSAYTWRVRPRDASGRIGGPWTDLTIPGASFQVVGSAPQLTAPADGSDQRSNDLLFAWNGVDRATDYRFERRLVGGGSSETMRTPGLAYAPSTVADGRWEWRVVALDSVGGEIGASGWWTFTVDQTAPKVSAVKPTGSVKRGANFTVSFSEPVNGVTRSTYKITPSGSKRKLSAVVKPSDDRTKAVLNPDAALKRGKSYTIKLTSKISDDSGNKLVTYSWTVTAK